MRLPAEDDATILLVSVYIVVPCLYKFEGKEKLVVRLREVVDKGRS